MSESAEGAQGPGETADAPSKPTLLDRALGPNRFLWVLDIALLSCLLFLVYSEFGFLFFYLSFMLLVLGAFFWNTRGFILRTLFWLSLNSVIVVQHIRLGQLNLEELLETPLLAGVLMVVYLVTRQREHSQQRFQEQTQVLASAREQVAESEKAAAVARLSASVAHDLRNPLGAISNAAYYVEKRLGQMPEAEDNPKLVEFLRLIRQQIDRSELCIANLIFFTRSSPPEFQPTDVHAIIDRCISPLIGKKNVRVHRNFDPGVGQLSVDGYLIQCVFNNLVHNAVESIDQDGDVTVTTALDNGEFVVTFQDTGKGMDKEVISQIFDPQFTTKLKGTGLGLPICQRLVAQHGGEILVDSKPGVGTTTTVKLPSDCLAINIETGFEDSGGINAAEEPRAA